jgi:Transposase DDE domain
MVKIKISIPPSAKSVRVSELINLVPVEFIEDLATELMVDKWVKKLKAVPLFKLVLFSILQGERLSLRMMEDNASDPLFKLLAPAFAADEATWGGIRDRLMRVKSAFFRRLYEKVYEMAAEKYGSKGLSTHHIKRFDSTMVSTFSYLLKGMQVGNTSKGKTQVKFTTELKDDFLIHMTFHKDQAHLSEETALKEAVVDRATKSKEEISVFDKGMKSRQSFAEFDAQQTLFVGRAHENPRYELLAPHTLVDTRAQDERDELDFIQDSAVNLYESNNKICPTKLRLIQYRIKKSGLTISFVTNVWDLDAALIAQVYKMRWDIEVLFRFMKQEMNLKHFVCNDKNAIEVMLYCTLIASMLVLIYKKKNAIKSYKRAKTYFFKELLYELLLEMLEIPEATEHLKQIIKKFVRKE